MHLIYEIKNRKKIWLRILWFINIKVICSNKITLIIVLFEQVTLMLMNHKITKPVFKYFKILSSTADKIFGWKPKKLSGESITAPKNAELIITLNQDMVFDSSQACCFNYKLWFTKKCYYLWCTHQIFGEDSMQRLDDATKTATWCYSINCTDLENVNYLKYALQYQQQLFLC